MKTAAKYAVSAVASLVLFVVMVFAPAGTFDYWQGWVFLIVFALCTSIPSLYLMRTNPAALERRMHAGPHAETRRVQKFIVSASFLTSIGMIVFSALDHRLGWSPVPTAVTVVGDVVVAIGMSVAMLVVIQNGYAAANVTVEADQTVVSTGLYGLVRHPMYAASIIMMAGIPLALDSYWGLVFIIPGLIVLTVRIRDEEQLLGERLNGYSRYAQQVRYRLLPHVW